LTSTATATPTLCQPNITVTQGAYAAIITGEHFKQCHAVSIYLDGAKLPFVGDDTTPSGSFTAIIIIPSTTTIGQHVITVTDNYGHTASAQITVVSMKGADGVDGKDGIDGKDGKDGVDGLNGAAGKDGINGVDGVNGVDGKDGINGTDGKDGAQGLPGINGTNGKDGVDGKDGINGATGARGYQGPKGEQGDKGNIGDTGATGQQGVQGVAGEDGKTTSDNFYGLVMTLVLGLIIALAVFCTVVVIVFHKK
jgi:hypothetical protein